VCAIAFEPLGELSERKDFPGDFNTPLPHVLYSVDLDVIDWDMIGPSVTDFVSHTQAFLQETETRTSVRQELIDQYLEPHRRSVEKIVKYAARHKERLESAFDQLLAKFQKPTQIISAKWQNAEHNRDSSGNAANRRESESIIIDNELWELLGLNPGPSGIGGTSDGPSEGDLVAWAKSEILSGKVRVPGAYNPDAEVSYLCRLLRVMEVLSNDTIRKQGVEHDQLLAAFASGLAASGCDLSQTSFCFAKAISERKKRGLIIGEDFDEWRPGMASGAGWRQYIRLTIAGRLMASKNANPVPGNEEPVTEDDPRATPSAGSTTPASSNAQSSQRTSLPWSTPCPTAAEGGHKAYRQNDPVPASSTVKPPTDESSSGSRNGSDGNVIITLDEKDRLVLNRAALLQHVQATSAEKSSKKRQRKRTARATAINAIKSALKEHLRAARDYAYETKQRSGVPGLLPRPTQKQLAQELDLSEPTVSRALNDDSDKELQVLWQGLVDQNYVMRSKR